MEIIFTIIMIFIVYLWTTKQKSQSYDYSSKKDIDWGKVVEDRIVNDLSDWEVNQNIIKGKYDKKKK